MNRPESASLQQAADVRALLARGGMSLPSGADGATAALAPPKYNGLSDPRGAEELGRLLAGRASGLRPTVVLVWEDPEDVVLAHVVARELGVPAVRAYDADGLVGHSSEVDRDGRALLVLDAVRDARSVRAVRALVEHNGGTLTGTVVLAMTDELAELGAEAGETISLADARETEDDDVGATS